MGYHSMNYYNTKCFKGNTQKTGFAWWYDASREDPNNPSHFEGFIPLSKMRDFFDWSAEESVKLIATFEIDGQTYEVPVNDYKALGRNDWIENGIPDNEEQGAAKILSVVTSDYGVHQPKKVFLSNVAELVDGADNIGVESFGELKWGRRLFASISVPDNMVNSVSGLEFRPILTIVTSFDRTLATRYVRTFGIPVCDNTVNYELARAGEKEGNFILRHSKNSEGRLIEAKKVLGLLNEQTDEMDQQLTNLFNVEVSESHFTKWLNEMVPIPEIKKTIVTIKSIQGEDTEVEKISTRAQTVALKKQDRLIEMWDHDPRVAPFKGTRLGILQLWNTFQQHEAGVKATKSLGAGNDEQSKADARVRARIEKNMDSMLSGASTKEDITALSVISRIQTDEKELVAAVPAGAPTSTSRKTPRKSAGTAS